MIESLLAVLGAGLSLWNHREKTHLMDRFLELRSAWYAEYNKPIDRRSDARLDNIERELRLISTRFAAAVGSPDSQA